MRNLLVNAIGSGYIAVAFYCLFVAEPIQPLVAVWATVAATIWAWNASRIGRASE